MDISLRYSCLLLFLAVLPAAQAMDGAPFVAPYNSYDAAYDFFGNISQNVSIATYTFSSPEIADMVLGIRQKGIRIRLLVDADPVGGIKDFLPMLCTLESDGIDVRLYTGKLRYMHAKYAVAGDSVIVTTENFGKSSFPPQRIGTKGYGIIIRGDADLARKLLATFNQDLAASKPPACSGIGMVNISKAPAEAKQPAYFSISSADLIVAPLDESGIEKVDALINSSKSLDIEQLYIQPWKSGTNPFLEAAISAARNGARVRILLDSTYNDANASNSNSAAARYANTKAAAESLDLQAEVYQGSAYKEIHSKAFFTDNVSFVSSINWNENSPTNNREVGIVISSSQISEYYEKYFDSDFSAGSLSKATGLAPGEKLPWTVAVAFVAILVIAVCIGKKYM